MAVLKSLPRIVGLTAFAASVAFSVPSMAQDNASPSSNSGSGYSYGYGYNPYYDNEYDYDMTPYCHGGASKVVHFHDIYFKLKDTKTTYALGYYGQHGSVKVRHKHPYKPFDAHKAVMHHLYKHCYEYGYRCPTDLDKKVAIVAIYPSTVCIDKY
jgi:hypothetical protein